MKVIIDNVSGGDSHPLTTKDIKLIHNFVINKFNFDVKIYRLSNQPREKSLADRPVRYDMIQRKLTICSRGLTREIAIREIFIAILQETNRSLRAASFNHLTNAQIKESLELANNAYYEFMDNTSESKA